MNRPNPPNKSEGIRGIPTVVLCGSTKFKDGFMKASKELGERGFIVISVSSFSHADGIELDPFVKAMLDAVHIHKISRHDMIYVVNDEEYLGESTLREIMIAASLQKPVYFKHDPPPALRRFIVMLGGSFKVGYPSR